MKTAAKEFLKFLGSLLLRLTAAILIGFLLLTLVYRIPTEPMEENMRRSAELLQQEGTYPWLDLGYTSMMDNFTDAIMLTNAASRFGEEPVSNAVFVYHWEMFDGTSVFDQMVAHYLEGEPYTGVMPYERYWHGYLLFLKPLLCLTDMGGIRMLNGAAQGLLLLAVAALLAKAGKKRYIPALLVSVLMLTPEALAKNLQYSSCYYAILLGCLALLLARDHLDKWEGKIFLYIGIYVAYFDFLTYPIATVGVPAALYFVLRESGDWKVDFGKMVKLCFCWVLGYGGMWAGKWILGSIVTGQNLLAGAISQVAERTGDQAYGETVENPFGLAWAENKWYFWNTPAAELAKLLAVVLLVLLGIALLRRKLPWGQLTRAIPFAIIMCMPVVWYGVLTNHSILHAFFTNKALVTGLFAFLCMLTRIPEPSKRPSE